MINPYLSTAIIWLSMSSQIFASADNLGIKVNYSHGDLKVHYDVPCQLGQTSYVASEAASEKSWRIELTPTRLSGKGLKIEASVYEDGKIVQKPTIILLEGESATTTIGNGGDRTELKLETHSFVN